MSDKGWVFPRDKRWVHAWPDPLDRSKRKQARLPATVRSESQAWAYVREHMDDLRSGKLIGKPKAHGPTLADLQPKWEALLAKRLKAGKLQPATVAGFKSHLKVHLLRPFGKRPVDEITIPELRRWVRDEMTGEPQTRRNVLNTLSTFFVDAMGEGWIEATVNPARSPAVRSELPEKEAGGAKVRMAIEDAQTLIDSSAPDRRRVRYLLAVTALLRDGEIAGRTIGDVHLDAPVPYIDIRGALQLRGPAGHATLGKAKTKTSVRKVPLHPATITALRWWIDVGRRRHAGRKTDPAAPLFPSASGGWYRPRSADRLRGDLKRAGLPTKIGDAPIEFHALRRTGATALRMLGVSREDVGLILGHIAKNTADEHYVEEDMGRIAALIARLPFTWSVQDRVRTSVEPAHEPSETGAPEATRTPGLRFRKSMEECASDGADARGSASTPADAHKGNGFESGIGHVQGPEDGARTLHPRLRKTQPDAGQRAASLLLHGVDLATGAVGSDDPEGDVREALRGAADLLGWAVAS